MAHYFDGINVRELAMQTGVPEGTVKWRLSAARQLMKKEWNDMQPMPIRPVRLDVTLSGQWPDKDVTDLLTTPTRSLLLWMLQTPMTIKELSEQTGIPAMLAEEEVKALLDMEALLSQEGGRFAASFFIHPIALLEEFQKLEEAYLPGLEKKLRQQMLALEAPIRAVGFDFGGRDYQELAPTFLLHLLHDGSFAMDGLPAFDPPFRPDGGRYYSWSTSTIPGIPGFG